MTNRSPLDEPVRLTMTRTILGVAEPYTVAVRPQDVLNALTDEQREEMVRVIAEALDGWEHGLDGQWPGAARDVINALCRSTAAAQDARTMPDSRASKPTGYSDLWLTPDTPVLICRRCGAIVHGDYQEEHDSSHEEADDARS